MENLTINGSRLWNSLMEMAQIGATKKGGVNRLALTTRVKSLLRVRQLTDERDRLLAYLAEVDGFNPGSVLE